MTTRVLIAGGGFAGTAAARHLGGEVEAVVISQDNFLLFTPMLAEVAAGDVDPRHIVTPVRQLAPRAGLVQGTITALDPHHHTVTVTPVLGRDPLVIEGDALVVSLGSVTNTYGVPGVEEHTLAFKSIADAIRIRNRLLALLETSAHVPEPLDNTVAVVGAGYSGAEVAAALADFLRPAAREYYRTAPPPKVILVDAVDRVTPALSPGLSKAAAAALRKRGVELVLGSAVASIEPDGLTLASGERVGARTIIWAAGVRPHPLVAEMGLPTDRGRLVVDDHLGAAPGVWALGDAAAVPSGSGSLSPPTAQFALRQGRYLGRFLPAMLAGERQVRPFSYRTKGELVSLGHRNAVGRVLGVPVAGIGGWFLWRTYYLLQLPTLLRKVRVAIDWTLDLIFPPDIAWIPSSDLGPGDISR
jgi:NADH dehydrogenase